MRYKVRNEDIRNICKNVIKWTRIRKSAWKNHVNWNDNRFAQIVKDEKETFKPRSLKVGHQHHRKIMFMCANAVRSTECDEYFAMKTHVKV
jgi:rhodanese-related sulfurtransferase